MDVAEFIDIVDVLDEEEMEREGRRVQVLRLYRDRTNPFLRFSEEALFVLLLAPVLVGLLAFFLPILTDDVKL